ncbi:MAG: bacillithiol biosynthesis cysteine-adding enzyme BshC [Flavobacteriales bacterium]|nr:bacillithiol biosynthesis cysteine-adding enzyme BshC [Flavobacteriales bacterium]
MTHAYFPLNDVPYLSELIKDYLRDHPALRPFHAGLPSLESIKDLSEKREFDRRKREVLVEAIVQQYKNIPDYPATKSALEKLKEETSRTVTTGHQICLLSGPLFSLYKIASTINLARQMEAHDSKRSYVPVFWMATEDHDFEEIDHVYVRDQKIVWKSDATGAVGRITTKGITNFLDEVESALPVHVLDSALWSSAKAAYLESDDLASATRDFFQLLFGREGLVIVDADDPNLKSLATEEFESELTQRASEKFVQNQSEALETLGYKAQVFPREVNLFYLTENQRSRLEVGADGFETSDGAREWKTQELIQELHQNPEVFSPNVVLRPVFQEIILPNVAYVGGPGELAYWLQLKGVFENFSVPFPKLVLRGMATFLSPSITRKMEQTGMSDEDIFLQKHDVIRKLTADHRPSFESDKQAIRQSLESIATKASNVDASLEGMVKSTLAKQIKAVEQIEGRVDRAIKKQNEDLVNRIEAIFDSLYPEGMPQERRWNVLELIQYTEANFITELINIMDPLDNNFKIIKT